MWVSEQVFINAGIGIDGVFKFPEIKVYPVEIIGDSDTFWHVDFITGYPNRRTILPHKIFATKEEAIANTLTIIANEEARLNKRLEELEVLRKKMV
jgi:hypothetical protein